TVAATATPTPTSTPCVTYNTSTTTGNTITPGVTDLGVHCDDCTGPVTFPFPVSFYGTPFNSGVVSSNGNLQFTGNTAYLGTSCPLPDINLGEAILPYQDDLHTGNAGEGIFTLTSGTAPNRTFYVEWRTHYFGRSGTANFEIALYEGQSFFDIFYGVTVDDGSLEESGVQQSATGPATTFSCHAATLINGLKVRYTLVPCPTPTPTPTGTPSCTPSLTMYGSNGNGTLNRGALITINQTNGQGTLVGTPVAGVGLPGLSFHPDGRLFASTVTSGSPSTLIQINPDTGGLIAAIGTINDN